MNNINVVILAAGSGSRMKSTTPKVLHEVAGQPMIDWVLRAVEGLAPAELFTVVGVGAEQVVDYVGERSQFVLQAEQLGTGHAVLQTRAHLVDKDGVTLIMAGDTPMFRAETLAEFVAAHENTHNAVTVLTAFTEDPTGYGRIVRGDDDNVLKIVEQKDASATERKIREINTGVFVFDNKLLFEALDSVGNQNAQGEYYLPDTLDILRRDGHQIGAHTLHDFTESLGVNDRVALSVANRVMRGRINQTLMQSGVELVDPTTTYIDADVQIGQDTLIEANVVIKGATTIGQNVTITAGSRIEDSQIGDNVVINASQIHGAIMDDGSDIGPFGHLRKGAHLAENVHVGNFVEVKNATLGANTKAGHLSYVGDATVGANVNIGAGTIFVNYDGVNKHQTTIGDDAFIGSNTKLVAPLTLGDRIITAAGSTITEDLPDEAMGIARTRQTTKENFWARMPHK
ncbi:MAG TPA: bifunctional UDP-N-acetylglucosamine diphosphorylase/glucosamine-1-phosphate N-acetyltransferase GlmU [Lactobacillaceae bacterium]|jgi:bifunctional UDP-N-acetylglucosamine pyrophosphorylase/glucosamine-1-phosphate N-acetyltransferase